MSKINLKYNPDGTLRPFKQRPFTKDMSDNEINKELLFSLRVQEKASIDNVKTLKAILLWIQIFGFFFLANIMICIVFYLYKF